MISAAKLHHLSNLNADQLTNIIQDSGYQTDTFITTKFRGMGNPDVEFRFIYDAMFLNEDGEIDHTVVFVSFNPTSGAMEAGY